MADCSILAPPVIQRDNLSSEVNGKLGQRISIACPAFGHPPPQITWLKGNKPIDELKDVYFASNRQRLHFVRLSEVVLRSLLFYKQFLGSR